MNSFWNTITTPLRFFEEQEEPTIPPPSELIQLPTVYDELPAVPARRTLLFEPDSSILSEPDSPPMIDPETLDAATLNERLNNLRIIEEIEAIQRRRSSLSLGQLAHPDADNDPFYESQDLLRELAKSSRLMAHSQSKTVEKETNENSKLKGLDTTDIIQFLATFNRKSCQPAYCQVPVPLRRGLVMTLGLPAGSTLESYYGEGLGPDVAFIRDLYQLVGSRTDVKPKEVLRAHCMSDVSTLNRTALMDMLAVCQEVVIAHTRLFDYFLLAECKEIVVSNIRPLPFLCWPVFSSAVGIGSVLFGVVHPFLDCLRKGASASLPFSQRSP